MIAAGGYASRALTLTGFGAKPKCLVNAGTNGATVLEEILREAEESGIVDLFIVHSADRDPKILDRLFHPLEGDPHLENYLKSRGKLAELELLRSRPRFRVTYARQLEPRGFGEAVGMAYSRVREGSFGGVAVALGDDLVHAPVPCLAQVLSAHRQTGAFIVAIQAVTREEARRYGVVYVEPEPFPLDETFLGKRAYRVLAVEEKPLDPQPNRLRGEEVYFAIVGRYVLNGDDVAFLASRESSLTHELDFTEVLRHNIAKKNLLAVEIRGTWHSVGTPLDAQKAFLHFALVPTKGKPTPQQQELARYLRTLLTEVEKSTNETSKCIPCE